MIIFGILLMCLGLACAVSAVEISRFNAKIVNAMPASLSRFYKRLANAPLDAPAWSSYHRRGGIVVFMLGVAMVIAHYKSMR